MKLGGKVLLFFSSYLPVWIIYSISQGPKLNVLSVLGIALTIVSILTIFLFKRTYETATRDNIDSISITKISSGSSEVISYLVSLVIPTATSTIPLEMLGGDFSQNIVITLIVSATIFLVYINSNLVVINPVMMMVGYSLYLISYKSSEESKITFDGTLIAKKPIKPEQVSSQSSLTLIDHGVYFI